MKQLRRQREKEERKYPLKGTTILISLVKNKFIKPCKYIFKFNYNFTPYHLIRLPAQPKTGYFYKIEEAPTTIQPLPYVDLV